MGLLGEPNVTRIGPWTLVERQWKPTRHINQGLATVTTPSGSSYIVYRGDDSVAPDLRARGWDHIGDPDAWGGVIFDAYQHSGPAAAAKLFRVTKPNNEIADFEHQLVTTPVPELPNNSFAAISPDGQWLVAGEWLEIDRLLVFPTPTVNAAAPPPGQDLKLHSVITLAQPVRNLQGAVFLNETTVLCSSDDNNPAGEPILWGGVVRPLLQISLAAALPDTSRPATVQCLGAIPSPAPGLGDPEVEGIDFDHRTGDLRVIVVPPPPVDLLESAVLRFRQVP